MKRPMHGPFENMFFAVAAHPGTPYIELSGKMLYVQAPGCILFCYALPDEDFNEMDDERLIRIAKVLMQRTAERN